MMSELIVLATIKARRGISSVFMKPRILSWNVWGLNKGKKLLRVRNFLRD